jgi:hypothetical protein
VKTVEEDAEVLGVGRQERLDEGEVKDRFEQNDIIGDRIDDRNFARSIREFSNLGQVNLRTFVNRAPRKGQ